MQMKQAREVSSYLIKLISLFSVLFILSGTSSLAWSNENLAEARRGLVDLSKYNFKSANLVELGGIWEFYWQQLLTPEDFKKQVLPKERGYLTVSQLWNNDSYQGEKLTANGYATYRLRFTTNLPKSMFGLLLPEIHSAYKVWVNQKLLLSSGKVGRSLATTIPGNQDRYSLFEVLPGENELLIQVANFHFKDGGIEARPKIGLWKTIIATKERTRSYVFFNLGALFLVICIYLILCLGLNLQRKEITSFLIICIAVMLRILVTEENYLYEFFPTLPWEFGMKLKYLSTSIIGFLFIQFFGAFIAQRISKLILGYLLLVTGSYLLVVLFFPAMIYSQLLGVLNVLILLAVFGVIFEGYKDLIKSNRWLKLMVVFFLTFGIVSFNEWLQLIGLDKLKVLFPLGILVYIIFQSFMLAKNYMEAFAEKQALSQKLLKLDQMKDEFMINTSRELRTPLNGMIAISESLVEGVAGKLPIKAVNNLEMIINSGKRLANLVNDLMDFVKLKNHQLTLKNNQIDLYQLTEVVLAISSSLLGEKELQLLNQVPLELPLIAADENRLQQIMCNLVSNAIKYTETGMIIVGANLLENEVQLTITDTGVGIPAEEFEMIFQAFEELDEFDFEVKQRTGLRLSITKYLVELHGGRIWVESQVGVGTKFSFTLPFSGINSEVNSPPTDLQAEVKLAENLNGANENEEQHVVELCAGKLWVESKTDSGSKIIFSLPLHQNELTSDEEKAEILMEVEAKNSLVDLKENNPAEEKTIEKPNENATIILLDDEPLELLMLENVLSLENYQVITFTNGYAALSEIKNGLKCDLVVLDAMMPKISGYEVCRSIRQLYSLFELPIIMLTTKGQANILEGFKCGANDYLMKPFEKKELLIRVMTLLTLKKAVNDALNYYEEIQEGYLGTVFALANSIEAKDIYTRGHCQRVMEYAVKIASELDLTPDEIIQLKYAALLHDIGKIGIDSIILNKPSRLTDDEYAEIKKHPQIAYNILVPVKFLEDSLPGVMQHHEWFNGKGYPQGLAGEEISLFGRILCVVDAFDAMTSDRSYRKGMPIEMALLELRKNKGVQFDPILVEIFIKIVQQEQQLSDEIAQ